MGIENPIKKLTIKGFKSIKSLELELTSLNVLIGANGAGKSNFISYFHMLTEMMHSRLQNWTSKQASADRVLSFGIKETDKIESFIEFGRNGYKFILEPTVDGAFTFGKESIFFNGPLFGPKWIHLGSGHNECQLKQKFDTSGKGSEADYCYSSISSWKIFHFHDTSETARVKRAGALQDNEFLRPDAANLAAYLYRLSQEKPTCYDEIRKTISLAIPFFDDFVLKIRTLSSGEEFIQLFWRQKNSDYPFHSSQLSDGSIRFICLVTALLQPNPPATIIIDEPELGLHPYAITLLGALLKTAATRMQVIVSTQSVQLVNEFTMNDLIIVERENEASIFKRCKEEDFKLWLETYSVGELWEKNILGGRPK
jgi:predicted ATPase